MTVDRLVRTRTTLRLCLVALCFATAVITAPAAAADRRAPRIVGASMQDTDGDNKADRLVLTYSERIKHRRDRDGRYPFKLSGPSYGIRAVNGARGTKKLVILLKEKSSPDPTGRPDVGYVKGKPRPVKDLAGNEARRQTFTLTMPLPCPANASTDFYANPVVNRTATPKPTGVSSPPWCAYPTLTSALSALQAKGGAGKVIATGAGSGTATFGSETFPLSVPSGVTLTTSLDPEMAGPGHNAEKYVVRFKGNAPNALDLGGGKVSGLTLSNARSTNASAMVVCGPGSSETSGLWLDGASSAGGQIENGLVLQDDCTLTDEPLDIDLSTALRVRDFAGTGVVVGNGATLESMWPRIHHNGGDGLLVQGSVDLDQGTIAFNGDDGIFVDHSSPSSFFHMRVRDNINNGIQVDGGDALFRSSHIWNNSRLADWDVEQVLFREAPPPDGVNTVLYWNGSSCVPVYAFGFGFVDSCTDDGPIDPYPGEDCDSAFEAHNSIYNYNTALDPVGSSERSVGMYAEGGAQVWADNNSWRTGDENQNVDHDASSFIDADLLCPAGGILTQDNDTRNEPVT